MKIIKTKDGNVAIILNPEEISGFIAVSGAKLEPCEIKGDDRLKGLRESTLRFLDEAKKKFGTAIIDRKDKKLVDLIFKCRVQYFNNTLSSLERAGLVAIYKKQDSDRIESFQFVD